MTACPGIEPERPVAVPTLSTGASNKSVTWIKSAEPGRAAAIALIGEFDRARVRRTAAPARGGYDGIVAAGDRGRADLAGAGARLGDVAQQPVQDPEAGERGRVAAALCAGGAGQSRRHGRGAMKLDAQER